VRLNPAHSDHFLSENQQLASLDSSNMRMILLGDSRIEMWSPKLEFPDYMIINRGIGGDTSAQALLRLQSDVIALNPDVVVVQIGINDLKAIGVVPEKKEWIIRQVKSNIRQMTSRLNEHGIHLLLMTVLPTAEPDIMRRLVWSDEIGRSVVSVNQYIRSLVSDEISIIDCTPVSGMSDSMNPEYALDTLHLNTKGYEALDKLLQISLMTINASKAGAEN